MTALDRESIRGLVLGQPPLVEGYLDLDTQLQPNGFDLTLGEVAAFASEGQVDFSNARRRLPQTTPLAFDAQGRLHLAPGPYLVTTNEAVHLPLGIMALSYPRSSLLRCGVAVHNAVGDAGFRGRYQALLVVYNPHGFWVERNARLIQLVFFQLSQGVVGGYQGRYQGM